jgi:hypothetical protein
LLSSGVSFFWRFVRITLLTLLISGLILGPLFALQGVWTARVEDHVVGVAALSEELVGVLILVLAASVLRLYFDLVEVYTVQLDEDRRADGQPDRRVRKTLLPAAKTLWRNLPRALGSFVFMGALGAAAVLLTTTLAFETLAQPRVWPQFLLIQLGLLLNLAARFWQRGAETILANENPLPAMQPADPLRPAPLVHDDQTLPSGVPGAEPPPMPPSIQAAPVPSES